MAENKHILVFNGKEYIQCDGCGGLTCEIPCEICGSPPISGMDDIPFKNFRFIDKETTEKDHSNHHYFEDDDDRMPYNHDSRAW